MAGGYDSDDSDDAAVGGGGGDGRSSQKWDEEKEEGSGNYDDDDEDYEDYDSYDEDANYDQSVDQNNVSNKIILAVFLVLGHVPYVPNLWGLKKNTIQHIYLYARHEV